MKYYKIISIEGRSIFARHGYRYPKNQWTKYVAKLEPCSSGYHVVTEDQVNYWLALNNWFCVAREVWEVQVKGRGIKDKDLWHSKYVFHSIKLVKKIGRFMSGNFPYHPEEENGRSK